MKATTRVTNVTLLLLMAACGKDPETVTPTPVDAPGEPPQMSAFEQCIAGGGTPKSLFSENNVHGPVTTITVSGSVVILGSADKSVKQWTIGNSHLYQTPFTTTASSEVAQLAHTQSNDVLGVDGAGTLHHWTLQDVSSDDQVTIGTQPLAAIGVNSNGSKVAVGEVGTPNLRVVEPGNAALVGPALNTGLTTLTSIAVGDVDLLIDAGKTATAPMIERRGLGQQSSVNPAESWTDATLTTGVTAIALAGDASILVAVGDGFVGTFAPGALATPTKLTKLPEHHAIGVALLSGKQQFVTVGSEGTLRVWDVATASLLKTLTIPTPIGVGADTDGTQLYTSGPDGQLHSWGCSQ